MRSRHELQRMVGFCVILPHSGAVAYKSIWNDRSDFVGGMCGLTFIGMEFSPSDLDYRPAVYIDHVMGR